MKRKHNLIPRQYSRSWFCDKDIKIEDAKECVYFITDGIYTKIGIADHLKNRLAGIKTANPREINILCVILCKDKEEMRYYENLLHKRFKKDKVRGEWFSITDYNIADAKEELNIEMCRVIA